MSQGNGNEEKGQVEPPEMTRIRYEGHPHWPSHLRKACGDRPWQYAVGLRSGAVIFFTGALCDPYNPEWVTLEGPEMHFTLGQIVWGQKWVDQYTSSEPSLEREIQVRVSDIEWVTDAPWGA